MHVCKTFDEEVRALKSIQHATRTICSVRCQLEARQTPKKDANEVHARRIGVDPFAVSSIPRYHLLKYRLQGRCSVQSFFELASMELLEKLVVIILGGSPESSFLGQEYRIPPCLFDEASKPSHAARRQSERSPHNTRGLNCVGSMASDLMPAVLLHRSSEARPGRCWEPNLAETMKSGQTGYHRPTLPPICKAGQHVLEHLS